MSSGSGYLKGGGRNYVKQYLVTLSSTIIKSIGRQGGGLVREAQMEERQRQEDGGVVWWRFILPCLLNPQPPFLPLHFSPLPIRTTLPTTH